MKIAGTVTLMVVTLAGANLRAEEQLPEAPVPVLESVKANCREYAEEDGINAEELNAYLLKCINDELSDLEFRAISSLKSGNL
jgi:hypothetical protein